jgi:hypothetical protein
MSDPQLNQSDQTELRRPLNSKRDGSPFQAVELVSIPGTIKFRRTLADSREFDCVVGQANAHAAEIPGNPLAGVALSLRFEDRFPIHSMRAGPTNAAITLASDLVRIDQISDE